MPSSPCCKNTTEGSDVTTVRLGSNGDRVELSVGDNPDRVKVELSVAEALSLAAKLVHAANDVLESELEEMK